MLPTHKELTREQVLAAWKTLNATGYLPPNTRRVLTFSTAMIRKETDIALHDDESGDPASLFNQLAYTPTDAGWLIYVTDHQASLELPGHEELAHLIELAYCVGFDMILIDRDADPLPEALGLPTFDW